METTVHVTFQRSGTEMRALIISPLLELTPQEAERAYRKRFRIETGYRDKHLFQGRTTSTHRAIRLVLLGMACMLWNLWRIFLLLGPDPSQGTLSRMGRWRRARWSGPQLPISSEFARGTGLRTLLRTREWMSRRKASLRMPLRWSRDRGRRRRRKARHFR